MCLTKRDPNEESAIVESQEYVASFTRDVNIKDDTHDVLSQDEQDTLKIQLEKLLSGEVMYVDDEGESKEHIASNSGSSNSLGTSMESISGLNEPKIQQRRRESIRPTLSGRDASALAQRLSRRIPKEQITGMLSQLKVVDELPQEAAAPHSHDEVSKVKLNDPEPLVKTCIAFLLKNGLEVPGLFRISVSSSELAALRNRLAKDPNHIPLNCDPNAVAGALKQYFRDMPEPVFPFELYDCVMAIHTIPDHAARMNCYIYLTKTLQPHRLSLLVSLMYLLKEVCLKSSINMMDSKNLALMFAPNILKPYIQTPQQMMVDMEALPKLVDELILNSSEIFQAYEMDIYSFARRLTFSHPLTEEELSVQPPPPDTRARNLSGTLASMFSFPTPNFMSLNFPTSFSMSLKKDPRSRNTPGPNTAADSSSKPLSPFGLSSFLGKMMFKKSDESASDSADGAADEGSSTTASSPKSNPQDGPPVPPRRGKD